MLFEHVVAPLEGYLKWRRTPNSLCSGLRTTMTHQVLRDSDVTFVSGGVEWANHRLSGHRPGLRPSPRQVLRKRNVAVEGCQMDRLHTVSADARAGLRPCTHKKVLRNSQVATDNGFVKGLLTLAGEGADLDPSARNVRHQINATKGGGSMQRLLPSLGHRAGLHP